MMEIFSEVKDAFERNVLDKVDGEKLAVALQFASGSFKRAINEEQKHRRLIALS